MNLDEALAATHAHPPLEEQAQLLREQVAQFRRDFYAHVMNLRRIVAAADVDEPPADLVQAQADEERALSTIETAINTTVAELEALAPDAVEG